MTDLIQAFPSVLAAFLASLVEFVEALTVVLAVGVTRGWRGALSGAAFGLILLVALVIAFGPALTRVPLTIVRLVVGLLVLLFGLRWLRKAILRSAGRIAMHDETTEFAKTTAAMQTAPHADGWDRIGMATAFKIVMLEGVEVVFIVVALGAAGGALLPVIVGALAALAVVVLLGVLLHRPLAHIPENLLKFSVGCLLAGFGTFWTGEGIGVAWPGQDWSILGLVAGYSAAALALVMMKRRGRQERPV